MLIYVNTIKCCACETLNLVQCSISEITSNRCNHIRPCSRSLDGWTLHLQNGGCPSDVAQSCSSSVCIVICPHAHVSHVYSLLYTLGTPQLWAWRFVCQKGCQPIIFSAHPCYYCCIHPSVHAQHVAQIAETIDNVALLSIHHQAFFCHHRLVWRPVVNNLSIITSMSNAQIVEVMNQRK